MFITFEGPEGAGKTTQVRLLAEGLRAQGRRVLVTHEPGGTRIGEVIRQLLLTPNSGHPLTSRAEAILFSAARAQLVDEVIRPALAQGVVVLCDRFSDSSLAYQVYGRGLAADAVAELIEFATGGLKPDVTFLLDLDVAAGLARKQGTPVDRLEQEEISFHQRVRDGYLEIARREPARIVMLDATQSAEHLAGEVQERLAAGLGEFTFRQ